MLLPESTAPFASNKLMPECELQNSAAGKEQPKACHRSNRVADNGACNEC